ncbi:hypothetical protein FQR65_LT20823 [Abscondita terminalis]|nr:hypothetical protein FQR65_LT20823 [Abscondita terminalis]
MAPSWAAAGHVAGAFADQSNRDQTHCDQPRRPPWTHDFGDGRSPVAFRNLRVRGPASRPDGGFYDDLEVSAWPSLGVQQAAIGRARYAQSQHSSGRTGLCPRSRVSQALCELPQRPFVRLPRMAGCGAGARWRVGRKAAIGFCARSKQREGGKSTGGSDEAAQGGPPWRGLALVCCVAGDVSSWAYGQPGHGLGELAITRLRSRVALPPDSVHPTSPRPFSRWSYDNQMPGGVEQHDSTAQRMAQVRAAVYDWAARRGGRAGRRTGGSNTQAQAGTVDGGDRNYQRPLERACGPAARSLYALPRPHSFPLFTSFSRGPHKPRHRHRRRAVDVATTPLDAHYRERVEL